MTNLNLKSKSHLFKFKLVVHQGTMVKKTIPIILTWKIVMKNLVKLMEQIGMNHLT